MKNFRKQITSQSKVIVYLSVLFVFVLYPEIYGFEKINFSDENEVETSEDIVSLSFKNLFTIEKAPDFSTTSLYEGRNLINIKIYSRIPVSEKVNLNILAEENILMLTQEKKEIENDNSVLNQTSNFKRFNLSKVQLDDERLLINAEIDFLFVDYTSDRSTFSLGRQPISFRRSYFWSPADWLNQGNLKSVDNQICVNGICALGPGFSPGFFYENEYLEGTDALRYSYQSDEFKAFEFIYALGKEDSSNESAQIVKGSAKFDGLDFDVLAGKFKNDSRIGTVIEKKTENISYISELSVFFLEDKADDVFSTFVLGTKYKRMNSLEINTEFYYNGYGAYSKKDYPAVISKERVISGEIKNLASYYLGIMAGYNPVSVIETEFSCIFNLVDNSNLAGPKIRIPFSESSVFTAGAFLASGEKSSLLEINSEYGLMRDMYFIQYSMNF